MIDSSFKNRRVGAGLLAIVLGCGAAPAQTADFSRVTQIAQGMIAGQNVETPVPGFELVMMRYGQVVYQRSFGLWSNNRIAAADSATKTLSAGVIMSLTENSARPFGLSSRLSEFIPQFSGSKATITVRQAFSHTAGLPASSLAVGDDTLTLQQASVRIANGPLPYPPGTTFLYGGVSMHAAGAAGEIAGGAPWITLFQNRIAGPLGLTATRYVIASDVNPRIAGGCESNGVEFSRFMEMVRNNGRFGNTQVLNPASVAAMLTRQSPPGVVVASSPLNDSSDYGVGMWLDQRNQDGRLTGAIAAGARGFSSWVDLDDGLVGTISTDLSGASIIYPALNLIRAAAEQAVRASDPCPADIDDGTGTWRPDGGVGIDDLLAYLDLYGQGAGRADVDNALGAGIPDGGVGIDDLLFFLTRYSEGC